MYSSLISPFSGIRRRVSLFDDRSFSWHSSPSRAYSQLSSMYMLSRTSTSFLESLLIGLTNLARSFQVPVPTPIANLVTYCHRASFLLNYTTGVTNFPSDKANKKRSHIYLCLGQNSVFKWNLNKKFLLNVSNFCMI